MLEVTAETPDQILNLFSHRLDLYLRPSLHAGVQKKNVSRCRGVAEGSLSCRNAKAGA